MIPILLFFGLCFFGLGDCDADVQHVYQYQENEVSFIDNYTKIYNSTDSLTEDGFAWDICKQWATSVTSLYCNEKELTDYDKYKFKLYAECNGSEECVNKKISVGVNISEPMTCDYETERMIIDYINGGLACIPISYDMFLLDKIESLEQRVSELEGLQSTADGSKK